ncbi:hypothetical protein NFI96_025216 [Prochilodus magdalenae]|nr:hypothetical protein NFI96_025216 [Prochilodus magdalenae]
MTRCHFESLHDSLTFMIEIFNLILNGGNRFALLWPDAENAKGVILGNNTIPILKSQQTTVFLPVVYIFIFIVGLPTNAMAIWVFLFRTKKKNPTSILMANLALADLLFIVWLPLKVAYHLNGNDWIFGESLCKVLVGFFYGNMYCSTIFIACISAQRYWTVAHPLSHKLNTRVTACVCVGVWVVVWLITVPLYLYEQTVKVLNLNTTTCHDVTRRNQTHFPVGYFLTMGIMGYVVPCVVCVVAYLLTFRSLSRSVTDPSNIKKKRRAVILMIIVLVMFLVCFTPSNILLMVHYFLLGAGHQNEVYSFYVVVLCLGSLNSCLDPFVYYFISEEFRKHLRTVLKCHNQQSSNMAAVCYRPVKPLMESPKTSSTPLSTRKLSLTTIFLPEVYIIIFIVGLPTNAMAVWVFLFRTKKKNPASILMANLALSDLLFIVWLPLKITYHLNGNDWIFGEPLCRVLVGFFFGNMYCSAIFIACVSVQRYWAIAHPLSQKFNTPVTVCVCVGVWVVVWLITVPLYLYEQTVKVLNLNITTCHDVTHPNQTHFPAGYFLTMGIVGYAVPCVVCIVSYLLTFRSLSAVSGPEAAKKKSCDPGSPFDVLCASLPSNIIEEMPDDDIITTPKGQEMNEPGVNLGDYAASIMNSSLTTVFLPVVYIIIFIVGLPTNAVAIWVFLFRTKKKNPASILMANLALSDLLFIVWLPLKITYHLNGNNWIFGESLCKVLVGFFFGNMYCSAIFIACISVQRYWTVAHPLSRKLNNRVTVCVCVGVWVVVWLITILLYVYEQTVKVLNLNTTTCHDVTRRNQTHFPAGYFLTMGIVGYAVPCVVCIVSYLLTFRSLSRSVIDARSSKKKRKAVILMITVLVMFLVCFTPSNIMLKVHYLLTDIDTQNDIYALYIVALCLGSLNSCLDPFVYYYISKEFRDNVKNTLRCRSERAARRMKVPFRSMKGARETPIPPTNTTTPVVEHTTEDSLNTGWKRGKSDDETAYMDEVQHLAAWCDDSNLVLNTQKTKEVIVDFRKSRNQTHTPIHISGAEVECVSNFKFLGVHISEDLTWSLNSSTMVKKAQQRLYFLRSLKKAHLCPRILVDFYRCTIESILTNCISVWYGSCSASDRKALQRVVKTAQRITGTQLPTTEYTLSQSLSSGTRTTEPELPGRIVQCYFNVTKMIPQGDPDDYSDVWPYPPDNDNNFTYAGLDVDCEVTEGVYISNVSMVVLNSSLTTVFLPVVYILIFIVGLPTNAVAIWVFLFRTKKKNPASILMANLALADLLFIVWLPLKIAYHLNGNNWIFGESLCRVLVGFFYGNMYCSAIFIACISVQRYWAIAHPLSHKPNNRVTLYVSVGVWVVVWLITVPLYLYEQTVTVLLFNITTCHDITRPSQSHFPAGYFLTMSILGYVVPSVLCIVAYLLTFHSLRSSITDSSSSKKKRKAIILMITVLVMFLVCFTPSNIMLMVHYWLLQAGLSNNVYGFYIVALCLGSLNSCLDPLVYYFISEEFRKRVKNTLMCRSERSISSRSQFSSKSPPETPSTHTSSADQQVACTLLTKTE